MLKIFMTGDNHIGLKYASHENAEVLRGERINAFERMVSIANEEQCDLFVITGDLFENTYSIAKGTIKTLLDMLSVFNGTVAVLPGNHDYYDKEVKLWQYFTDVMKDKDNILLLKDYRPYEVSVGDEEVVLYPALCTTLHSEQGENNLGWIKDTEISKDGRYHIGVAHGAVEGETIDSEAQYFLMKREELESIPVDVWLIGHTHVSFPRDLSCETYKTGEKIYNAGTHVQTDVSCNTEGYCFVVEIDENKEVKAKKVNSGNLRFYRKNITLKAGEMKRILAEELQEIDDFSVVDLSLFGVVSAEEYEDRIAVLDNILSRFVEGTYNDSALSKLITKDIIEKEFPETSFSANLLSALLDDTKEAQLVYELLKSLKKEGK